MTSDRKARRIAAGRLCAPSLIALAALGAFFVPGAAERLRWERAAVPGGELWRILTCHLVHANADHLVWDVAATFLLGLALVCRRPRLFFFVTAASAVAIPLGVHLLLPSLDTYCGLSGIASALFAAYAVLVLADGIREGRPALAVVTALVALAFTAKVGFEAVTGGAVFVDLAAASVVPVPLAHLLGAVAGAAGAATAAWGTKAA